MALNAPVIENVMGKEHMDLVRQELRNQQVFNKMRSNK